MENRSFLKFLKLMRKVLPFFAFGLLFFVYGVTTLLHGGVLVSFLEEIPKAGLIAYGMGGAIQITRGVIIFFRQLNPISPDLSVTGEVIGVSFSILAVGEIIYLVSNSHLNPAIGASAAILMISGGVLEIFLYRQVKLASEMELFTDRGNWEKFKDFARERAQLLLEMDEIEAAIDNPTSKAPTSKALKMPLNGKTTNSTGFEFFPESGKDDTTDLF